MGGRNTEQGEKTNNEHGRDGAKAGEKGNLREERLWTTSTARITGRKGKRGMNSDREQTFTSGPDERSAGSHIETLLRRRETGANSDTASQGY